MIIKLLVNLIILLFVPFIMTGLINKTKAFWAGRKGASVFQPLYDFVKLVKKDFVVSKTTSAVFNIAPVFAVASVLFAGLFVPLATGNAVIITPGDVVIFAYTLGLGKFMMLISAMDTGSSFEGMGASREACFSAIVEPAFFMLIASVMVLTGIPTFYSLYGVVSSSGIYGILVAVFAVIILFIMLLTEGARVPVDDPDTHLELTMIHEVMLLDNSGLDLALFSWANSIKVLLISSLIVCLIIPFNIPVVLHILCYLLVAGFIAVVVGTVESGMARIRMPHVFEFIFIMSSLALVVISLVMAKVFGG